MLITGASTGIGAATARQAVEAGWRVVLGARGEERLAELASSLGGESAALYRRCDVAEWEDQQELVKLAVDGFGGLDVVFANAGFGAKRGFLEESVEQWKAMIDTNVLGTALTIRATLPTLREQGRGQYVITSSVAGRRALPGSLYAATKHAVTAMGEGLRQEVSDSDIKVTLIEPGMVDTPFFENRPNGALAAEDIASAVMWAISQPANVDVNEVLIRPVRQAN
jgi:NADP-dependent 3-hydroxy acid dehydrogenase YdfG